MPEQTKLEKAFLQQISWSDDNRTIVSDEGDSPFEVQFNPETLKQSFSNQLASGDDSGGAAIQFASKGTTKLSMDLIFDVTAPDPDKSEFQDVRKLTEKVVFFMKTKPEGSGEDIKHIAPGIRFQWGSFLFEGVMESINETLEFFSREGRPLRATVSISLVKQDVDIKFAQASQAAPAQSPASATTPQQAVRQNEPMQKMAGRLGKQKNWQGMALANNIETPRLIPTGTLIDV